MKMKKSRIVLIVGMCLFVIMVTSALAATFASKKQTPENDSFEMKYQNNDTSLDDDEYDDNEYEDNIHNDEDFNDRNNQKDLYKDDKQLIKIDEFKLDKSLDLEIKSLKAYIIPKQSLNKTSVIKQNCNHDAFLKIDKNENTGNLVLHSVANKKIKNCYVVIEVPVNYDDFKINCSASSCQFIADTEIVSKNIEIVSNSGSFNLKAQTINVENLELTNNSGKLDLNSKGLNITSEIVFKNNSGKTQFELGSVKLKSPSLKKDAKFIVQNNTGMIKGDIDEIFGFEINANNNLGNLKITENDKPLIDLAGFKSSQHYSSTQKAQKQIVINLRNSTGMTEVNLNAKKKTN